MKLHTISTVPLGIFAVVSPVLLFAGPALAASSPAATLYLTPASATVTSGNSLTVDITINTGGQGAAGVDIHLTLPAGLTYSSYDGSTSVFTAEVTPPTVNGTDLHLARALITAGGYTGTNGEVERLVFTTSGPASVAQLAFNQATSSVAAYSDSANILNAVSNGTYTITPVVASTPSPAPNPVVASTPKPIMKPTALPVTGSSLLSDAIVALFSLATSLFALLWIRKEFVSR